MCRAPSDSGDREAGLEEQALESGLVVEMSSRPKEGWLQFDSVTTLTQTTDDPHFPGLPLTRRRTLFSSPSDESSLVFIDLTPMCRPNSKMPSRVWVRVTELNLGRLAAVEMGLPGTSIWAAEPAQVVQVRIGQSSGKARWVQNARPDLA